ncbi:MAG TPA: hypothetical protein PKJ37_10740 [Acidobacteriota bacterium]|nr:hypothetical protein [Acidobacteriota bacterium]HNT18352.1 hypothetical protein [Acidobacteriota bacterium]
MAGKEMKINYAKLQDMTPWFLRTIIFALFLFVLASCDKNKCPSKNDEDNLQLIEKIRYQLEPGLETDLKWYKTTMENIVENKILELAACDYRKLWNNTYAYRDRKGAMIIANYLNKNNYSRFWRDCFYTLAEGQEKHPASLDNLMESDLCDIEIGTPLWNLFSYSELESINFQKVKAFLAEMQHLYNLEALHPEPPIKKNPWTNVDYFRWVSSKPGDPLHIKNINPLSHSPHAIAHYAFKSCYYESANKAVLEVGGGGLESLYYAGHSIHLEKDSMGSDNICLVTDDGHRIETGKSYKDIDESIKVLLELSEGRDRFEWLKQN